MHFGRNGGHLHRQLVFERLAIAVGNARVGQAPLDGCFQAVCQGGTAREGQREVVQAVQLAEELLDGCLVLHGDEAGVCAGEVRGDVQTVCDRSLEVAWTGEDRDLMTLVQPTESSHPGS